MNDEPQLLLNPNGTLLPDIERRLVLARKTKPLWAKVIEQTTSVNTIEGPIDAKPGDFLCRGIAGETWPQKSSKVLEKYSSSGCVDSEGWQRFDPIPDSAPVQATQVCQPFRVVAHWGQLTAKANDYVVRSTTDPTDIWVVDRAIFEASYELRSDGIEGSSATYHSLYMMLVFVVTVGSFVVYCRLRPQDRR